MERLILLLHIERWPLSLTVLRFLHRLILHRHRLDRFDDYDPLFAHTFGQDQMISQGTRGLLYRLSMRMRPIKIEYLFQSSRRLTKAAALLL